MSMKQAVVWSAVALLALVTASDVEAGRHHRRRGCGGGHSGCASNCNTGYSNACNTGYSNSGYSNGGCANGACGITNGYPGYGAHLQQGAYQQQGVHGHNVGAGVNVGVPGAGIGAGANGGPVGAGAGATVAPPTP